MENRIIKFRCWAYASRVMFYPDDDGIIIAKGNISPLPNTTVMQFTGLQDKNGKDIYEGDICSGHSDGNGKIVWTNYDGGYDYEFDDGNIVGINEVLKEIEVIGNIFSNPELLK